jgi:aminoglycoside phosphotransferase family enzyme
MKRADTPMSPPTLQSSCREPSRDEQAGSAMLRALRAPAAYGIDGPVDVHETHASWVFITGEHAYKIKTPVALGFLDYSTLSLRHAACREEVRVNQELAPGVYLGVLAVVKSQDGFRLAPEGSPDVAEYAVAMRSFCESDTIAAAIAADALTAIDLQRVAKRVAAFHRRPPKVDACFTAVG